MDNADDQSRCTGSRNNNSHTINDDATTRRCLSQDRQEQLHPTQLLLLGNELEHDHDDNNPQILFIIITRKIIPISPIPVTPCTYLYISFLRTCNNEGTKTLPVPVVEWDTEKTLGVPTNVAFGHTLP